MEAQDTKLELKGPLKKYFCAELFAEIGQAEFSGSLRLSHESQKVIVYFENGAMIFAVSNSRKHSLFEILRVENIVSKEKLEAIEGYANDLHLAKKLKDEGILTKYTVESIFSIQIKQIIKTIFMWESGEWQFSPLARIKEGIGVTIDIKTLLRDHANTIDIKDILGRFRSVTERFSMSLADTNYLNINPTPNEAFVLSRIGEGTLTIDEITSMCGLGRNEVFTILYGLWLGGIIKRENWNAIIKPADVAKINDAKLTLKRSATSFEDEQEKARLEEETIQLALEEEERIADEVKQKEKARNISLEDYLKRIEAAATHYELFDLPPDSDIGRIKKIYFSYAKNFHPDLFHKKFDGKKLLQIQKAFTEIARAYDTLKDKDSREVYDFKLRKVIEASMQKAGTETVEKNNFEAHKNAQTAVGQFETGYNLLMNGEYKNALPYLERAVTLDDGQPRYHAYFGKALSHEKKNRHRAESELHIAVNLDYRNSVFRMMLAELYFDIGLMSRAQGELKKLLEIHPNDKEAQSLMDRVFRNL